MVGEELQSLLEAGQVWPLLMGQRSGNMRFFPDDDILMFMIVHLKFIYHDLCDFM